MAMKQGNLYVAMPPPR